jgi:hypothetical protein
MTTRHRATKEGLLRVKETLDESRKCPARQLAKSFQVHSARSLILAPSLKVMSEDDEDLAIRLFSRDIDGLAVATALPPLHQELRF